MSEETLGILRGVATALAMLAFTAVVAWAWSRRRHENFQRAAQAPLEEDPTSDVAVQGHTGLARDESRRHS